MGNIREEITSNAKILNIEVQEIAGYNVIINNVKERYASSEKKGCLWERFIDDVSVCDENAWSWVGEYVGDEKALMFFPGKENIVIGFANGKDVVTILENSFGFEFYITNAATDYVLCFNHHDYLIACGKAVKWLKIKAISQN